jgi:hypothetical protein
MYSEILYHGTHNKEGLLREGFKNDMFLSGMGRMKFARGFYATSDLVQAQKYGEVVSVQVTLKNPFMGYIARFRHWKRRENEITDTLVSEGYDGIVINQRKEVCVFDAKNIKVV